MVVEAGSSGRHQLLDEERVAAATTVDLLDELPVGRRPVEGLDQQAGLPTIERPEREPFAVGATFQLGEQRAEGVAAVQLVIAERPDEQDRTPPTGMGQCRQQHPGRGVGPVEVLDHEEQRPPPGDTVEHPDDELTELLAGDGRCIVRDVAELRQQPGQGGASRSEHEVDSFVVQPANDVGDQVAYRGQRQDRPAEVDAASDPDPHATSPCFRGEVLDEAGLADAGLAGDQHDRRSVGADEVEGV